MTEVFVWQICPSPSVSCSASWLHRIVQSVEIHPAVHFWIDISRKKYYIHGHPKHTLLKNNNSNNTLNPQICKCPTCAEGTVYGKVSTRPSAFQLCPSRDSQTACYRTGTPSQADCVWMLASVSPATRSCAGDLTPSCVSFLACSWYHHPPRAAERKEVGSVCKARGTTLAHAWLCVRSSMICSRDTPLTRGCSHFCSMKPPS